MKVNDGNLFTAIVAAMGTVCGFLFGELDGLLIAVLVLMVIDYITGISASIVLKTTDSKISWKGIIKKFVMLLILVVAHTLDVYVLCLDAGSTAIMSLVEFLYIANEGLSIIENAGKLGIKLPKALKEALVQLRITASPDNSKNTDDSNADSSTSYEKDENTSSDSKKQ